MCSRKSRTIATANYNGGSTKLGLMSVRSGSYGRQHLLQHDAPTKVNAKKLEIEIIMSDNTRQGVDLIRTDLRENVTG